MDLRMITPGATTTAAIGSLVLTAALLACVGPASAEPRFSFATTPGKLPKDVVPKHYALRIVPAATYDRFDAEAVIDIEVARPVPAIVVNAAELSFESVRLRASFEIVAVIDASLTAVSNMPQSRVELRPDGRKEVSFARSVPMPTYLVGLFVGEMDLLEDSVDGIRLGIHTVKGKRERARYAMEATKELLHYYNDYFGEA